MYGRNSASRKAGVQDWVESNFFDARVEPEKSYEKTRVFSRDSQDLLSGCEITELDINLGTIPAELLDLFEK